MFVLRMTGGQVIASQPVHFGLSVSASASARYLREGEQRTAKASRSRSTWASRRLNSNSFMVIVGATERDPVYELSSDLKHASRSVEWEHLPESSSTSSSILHRHRSVDPGVSPRFREYCTRERCMLAGGDQRINGWQQGGAAREAGQ